MQRIIQSEASGPPDPGGSPERPRTLEQLMVLYQKADKGAAAALVDQLSPRLHRFFANQMGNPVDASDMLQEVWLRIHRVRHTYRPGTPLLPWVFSIAHHVRIDGYRKRRRVASREIAVEQLPEPRFTSSSANASGGPADISFAGLLQALPESQREVLILLKVQGLTIDEIAKATTSTAGAVKQKAHRAYLRLREVLRDRYGMGVRK